MKPYSIIISLLLFLTFLACEEEEKGLNLSAEADVAGNLLLINNSGERLPCL